MGTAFICNISADINGMCRWSVTLPPTMSNMAHMISATSQKYGSATLNDVLFGDVWLCSGQSNMQFTVPQVTIKGSCAATLVLKFYH